MRGRGARRDGAVVAGRPSGREHEHQAQSGGEPSESPGARGPPDPGRHPGRRHGVRAYSSRDTVVSVVTCTVRFSRWHPPPAGLSLVRVVQWRLGGRSISMDNVARVVLALETHDVAEEVMHFLDR